MAFSVIKRAEYATVTIAASGSLTSEIDLQGRLLIGIIMPASWTAADLTFQAASASGGTFNDVYDHSGTEFTVTAAASRHIRIKPENWMEANFVKVRSGTTATPVNQAAERTLTLVLYDAG